METVETVEAVETVGESERERSDGARTGDR